MTKQLSKEEENTLIQIEASLSSDVGSFMRELKKRHAEEPDEYPLDDGVSINEWFYAHMNQMEW